MSIAERVTGQSDGTSTPGEVAARRARREGEKTDDKRNQLTFSSPSFSSPSFFSAPAAAAVAPPPTLFFPGGALFLLPMPMLTLRISPNLMNSSSSLFSSQSYGMFLTKQFVNACASGLLSLLMNCPTCTSRPSMSMPSSFSIAPLAASFVS